MTSVSLPHELMRPRDRVRQGPGLFFPQEQRDFARRLRPLPQHRELHGVFGPLTGLRRLVGEGGT